MLILRIILGIVYALAAFGFCFLGGLAVWATNWKMGIPMLAAGGFSIWALCEAILFKHPMALWLITLGFAVAAVLFLIYITEPQLGIMDRLKSPERLLREGKKEKAALQYKRRKKWIEAAKIYEEIGWLLSAAVCYEEAKEWGKVAELYEKLAEKEDYGDYYLRKAKEIYEEKLGNLERAAEILETLAQKDEGWWWPDAAKMWEKAGRAEKAKECWQKALEYYRERATKEDGVFWDDVAGICERMGMVDEAIDAYRKFMDYVKEQLKETEDRGWLRHLVEVNYALFRLTGEQSYKAEGDKIFEDYKKYLDEIIVDDQFKKEIMEEVQGWLKERVEPKI